LLRGEVKRLEGKLLGLNTILESQVKEMKHLNEEVRLISLMICLVVFVCVKILQNTWRAVIFVAVIGRIYGYINEIFEANRLFLFFSGSYEAIFVSVVSL
jgi:phosphatidylserine synthase